MPLNNKNGRRHADVIIVFWYGILLRPLLDGDDCFYCSLQRLLKTAMIFAVDHMPVAGFYEPFATFITTCPFAFSNDIFDGFNGCNFPSILAPSDICESNCVNNHDNTSRRHKTAKSSPSYSCRKNIGFLNVWPAPVVVLKWFLTRICEVIECARWSQVVLFQWGLGYTEYRCRTDLGKLVIQLTWNVRSLWITCCWAVHLLWANLSETEVYTAYILGISI